MFQNVDFYYYSVRVGMKDKETFTIENIACSVAKGGGGGEGAYRAIQGHTGRHQGCSGHRTGEKCEQEPF